MAKSTSGWFVGEGTLLVQCAERYRNAGHTIRGVIALGPVATKWAQDHDVPVRPLSGELSAELAQQPFDYLFSVGNHTMLASSLISTPSKAAINFHYGPLPRFAGVHVPTWALLEGESEYGVTWHEMTPGVDAGRVVKAGRFAIPVGETSAGLHARCFEAGLETFSVLLDEIGRDALVFVPQDFATRRVFTRYQRPPGHGILDWSAPAVEIERIVRALSFAPLDNDFSPARAVTPAGTFLVNRVDIQQKRSTSESTGTLLALTDDGVTVATATTPVILRDLTTVSGQPLTGVEVAARYHLRVGDVLPMFAPPQLDDARGYLDDAVRHEGYWLRALNGIGVLDLPHAMVGASATDGLTRHRLVTEVAGLAMEGQLASAGDRAMDLAALVAAYVARSAGVSQAVLAFSTDLLCARAAAAPPDVLSDVVPVNVDLTHLWLEHLDATNQRALAADERGAFFVDLCARFPEYHALRHFDAWRRRIVVHLGQDAVTASADLCVRIDPSGRHITWDASARAFSRPSVERMQQEFAAFAANVATHPHDRLGDVSLLSEQARAQVLKDWNDTDRPVPAVCVHELIEQQAQLTPERVAVSFRDRRLTFRELNRQANRLAAQLRHDGIRPDQVVGVFVDRSLEMVVALLGILKAGAAYLPLDPEFPQERLAWMLEDTAAPVVITQPHLEHALPRYQGRVLPIALPAVTDADDVNVPSGVTPANLAYVIFTSGSTGRPKGVMVEHRQVVNFFVGMDEYLGAKPPGRWLAVTSISFDISVLELFWTLARGYAVVVQEELAKTASAQPAGTSRTGRPMEFGLFYFSADARADAGGRYRLLLEGAKFADAHGFKAVWTPERHFHEFGGLYPNPAVTSAAIATVTSHVRVRAGSVVLPLHNPIRIAEEWAVVDHLSGGRVELSFASGWHANDFALMPQNYASRRDVMLSGIETIRRLWRGESITVTNGRGEPVDVSVFPRPLQERPPFWLAAAGNIETFRQAGRLGAYLLTNLLGQKIDEVATKIAAYRAAWKDAGHAGDGVVALMLHTFVGPDLERVRETVRRPLIEYLKTSTDLVKQTRWEFPAFANPGGKGISAEVELSPEEVDALMTHAFDRYFETSGLFGTPEMCVAKTRELMAIGVDEIACLIDFGIDTDTVLANLPYLDEVRRSCEAEATGESYGIADQIVRHRVTHLQATPSLIRAVLADERGRAALATVDTLLLGGEPMPPALATELLSAGHGELLNMYGPTETTVWSSVARIVDGADVTIGRPIANTQIYIVDERGEPVPVGTPGELLIGGLGVTRGYWHRPELTSERFVPNRCEPERGGAVYRTGDLARYRPDGRIECLGRIDHQVKISGHRIELGEIESMLDAHPSVTQSVVAVKTDGSGEPRLVGYVVPKATVATTDPAGWQTVWDETYGGIGREASSDTTFDLSGWRSSYTGTPMDERDMREWVDTTVDRLLSFAPRRVLEIGCGTGLLLHRLAPAVECYVAIDFSPTVVKHVQDAAAASGLRNVMVRCANADALAQQHDIEPVDLVIINSVAQYFPGAEYLTRVLEQAVGMVRPGGVVFVGDVRNLQWLEAFHASIELVQAPSETPVPEFRRRVQERVSADPELVIAPEYFEAFGERVPTVGGVDVLLRHGKAHNEMTCFRYDALLFVGERQARRATQDVDGREMSLESIREQLARTDAAVTIRNIRNPRLVPTMTALRAAGRLEPTANVAELRRLSAEHASDGIEPDDLEGLCGCDVDIRPAASGTLDEYDATFWRRAAVNERILPALAPRPRPAALVHEPRPDRGQLVQTLKQHLRARLPGYMVPGAFVVLDALPLTPNGKIDRKVLPDPDRQRQESAAPYVAPAGDVERVIADTWQELLALERISTTDNFFDIGANSLLMVQAHAALRERLGRRLSLVDLFRFPTVAALAAHLDQAEAPGESAVLASSETRGQSRADALNRRRNLRQTARTGEGR